LITCIPQRNWPKETQAVRQAPSRRTASILTASQMPVLLSSLFRNPSASQYSVLLNPQCSQPHCFSILLSIAVLLNPHLFSILTACQSSLFSTSLLLNPHSSQFPLFLNRSASQFSSLLNPHCFSIPVLLQLLNPRCFSILTPCQALEQYRGVRQQATRVLAGGA
jgi:hypothetical protein